MDASLLAMTCLAVPFALLCGSEPDRAALRCRLDEARKMFVRHTFLSFEREAQVPPAVVALDDALRACATEVHTHCDLATTRACDRLSRSIADDRRVCEDDLDVLLDGLGANEVGADVVPQSTICRLTVPQLVDAANRVKGMFKK